MLRCFSQDTICQGHTEGSPSLQFWELHHNSCHTFLKVYSSWLAMKTFWVSILGADLGNTPISSVTHCQEMVYPCRWLIASISCYFLLASVWKDDISWPCPEILGLNPVWSQVTLLHWIHTINSCWVIKLILPTKVLILQLTSCDLQHTGPKGC